MMKKFIWIAVALLIVGLIAVKLALNKRDLDRKRNPVSIARTVPVAVTVASAEILPIITTLLKTGTLLPIREVQITSLAQGRLDNIRFELGANVVKGQSLALVDFKLKQLALEQSELAIKKLENDSARFQELLEGNAATEMQVNEIVFNLRNAKTQARQMRKQIADATVTAPISGVIVRKNFSEGEFVNPGFNLGTVVDLSLLKVRVNVSESEVYRIRDGQEVKVTSDIFPGKTYAGKVNFVSPRGDDAHNYPVEVTLFNDEDLTLKAGTFVYVDFTEDTEVSALQIPRNALVESVRNPYVYVVEDSVAKIRVIKVGRESGENIETLDGLKPGELVVTSGQINLKDNAVVRVVK